jgi:hypothetical protein
VSRYLSPEPLLQVPQYALWMAKQGLSTPTYAYAGNDPLGLIDPDGLHRRRRLLRPQPPYPPGREVPRPPGPDLPRKRIPDCPQPGREDTEEEKGCEAVRQWEEEDCYERHPAVYRRDDEGHRVRVPPPNLALCLRDANTRYGECLKNAQTRQ